MRNGLAVGAKEVKEFELPEKSYEFYKKNWGDLSFQGKGKYKDAKNAGEWVETLGGDVGGFFTGVGQSAAVATSKASNAAIGGTVTAAKAVTKFASENIGTIITVTVCGAGVAFAPIITLCIARLIADAVQVAWDAQNGIQDVANWARTVVSCGPSCNEEGNGGNGQYGDCAEGDMAPSTTETTGGPDCLKHENDQQCVALLAKIKEKVKEDQLADLDKL